MEKTASTPIQLFRGMTADELAALRAAHCIRVQRYDKNALIYHAGRVVHEIGIVQSGSVNVESNDLWGNKSILSHVEAGQAFAETYALCGEPLMVDVAAAAESLLKRGDGDAALLYLALQRFGRGVTPEELERVLPTMSRLRMDAAEGVLQELGLLPRPQQPRPEPAEERAVYSTEDISALLTDNEGFRLLIPQAEQQLGKKLRTADLQILAGLYDDLGLPADVIYLLLCHCVERAKAQWGEGRRPTMRQVEKEGYHWAQMGLFDQVSAAAYLRTWSRRRQKMGAYMQALHLPDRPPVEAESRYIADWMDMGFPPETVAMAYERTVFYKKDMNWRYLNGILRRWHDSGWHTPQQVERGEARKPSPTPPQESGDTGGQQNAWMRRYIKR